MPPKPSNVDGITRQAVPAPPHSLAPSQPGPIPINNQTPAKSQVKTSKVDHGVAIVIALTLICMVLLIALAYFAYNKSK